MTETVAIGPSSLLLDREFEYALNRMENAGAAWQPAEHGYGEKRRAVFQYVGDLQRKVAVLEADKAHWEKVATDAINRRIDESKRVTALAAALRDTISYAEQLDLIAYEGLERDTPHAVIVKAREALGENK